MPSPYRNQPHELSPYAPIRLREEIYWKIGRMFLEEGWIYPDGRIRQGMPERLWHEYTLPMIEATLAAAKAREINPSAACMSAARFMDMRNWVPLVAQYEGNGRQIFDFHDRLTEMLVQTDLGECTLASVKLPYDAFFIYFGRQAHIHAPWFDKETGNQFECIDGAFIAHTPWQEDDGSQRGRMRLKIGLSTVKDDGSGVFLSGHSLEIQPDEAQLPVLDAVAAALKRTIDNHMRDIADGTGEQAIAQARVDFTKEGAELITKAAPLIFNALFYLESLGKLPDESPGRNTSPALTQKWLSSKPERRFKVKQEMKAHAYTVVRLVGAEFADQTGPEGVTGTGSKRPHWRRGFWRENQPYGPREMQLRKRAWVRPTIVGVDRQAHKPGSDEIPGHVYVPGPDRAQ